MLVPRLYLHRENITADGTPNIRVGFALVAQLQPSGTVTSVTLTRRDKLNLQTDALLHSNRMCTLLTSSRSLKYHPTHLHLTPPVYYSPYVPYHFDAIPTNRP